MFSKSLAEKKLEELTGGFLINKRFENTLKENGLMIADGEVIKKQLKREIKSGVVSVDGLEIRLNYLMKKKAEEKGVKPSKSGDEPIDVKYNVKNRPLFAPYKKELDELKEEYDKKEQKVTALIEKAFAPPQITYDKFMDSVKKSDKVFNSQYDSANNIIENASQETPRMQMELEGRLSTLKAIISYIDDLINELIINLSSSKKSSREVDLLFDDMEELIDSIKKYEH